MEPFQLWLIDTLSRVDSVSALMRTQWAWPVCESLHFAGLSMLFGTIGMFDLRLLGVAKQVPIAALHRLVPWGVGGYLLNVATGAMFLMTEPDQYILNPAFHFKMLFMTLAGLNVLTFYVTMFRGVKTVTAGGEAPRAAKMVAAASLLLWIGVTIGGRLLTFYRPFPCGPEGPGFIASCYS
jgi:uncharacterized membrane protein